MSKEERSRNEPGITADHPPLPTREVRVAPTLEKQFNTVKAQLIPFACWRVNDMRFGFNSSFVEPTIADEIIELKLLLEKHSTGELNPPLTVFGHADPVGHDDINKALSGRRAKAIYGLLVRDIAMWEELYSNAKGEDRWGEEAITTMLNSLSPSIERTEHEGQDSTVKRFQREHGLVEDGIVGPNTRHELFNSYINFVCGSFQLKKTDFLARGSDSKFKGDIQGCSEFNPLMLFSSDEKSRFEKAENHAERNLANAINRRVMIFLFRPGTEVDPTRWPCPRADEGIGACRKRFWSDGENRRTRRLPDERREFAIGKDTFACRFYDRLSNRSPCETLAIATLCHISVLLRSNSGAVPIGERRYRIILDSGIVLKGTTTEEGFLEHKNIPAGDYPLELEGVDSGTFIPTTPLSVTRVPLRVIDHLLFDPGEPQDSDSGDPNRSLQVVELDASGGSTTEVIIG